MRTDLDTYDAASRKTDTTYSISGGSGDPNCAAVSNTSSDNPTPYAFAYDAENHHIGARGAQWTPVGRAYYFGLSTTYIHYDGNVPLFFTDTTGALTEVKLEAVADITGAGLSVWDRDMSGLAKAGHNSGYYSSIDLGETMWRGQGGMQPLQIAFLGSANSSNLPALFLYKRLDGFDYSGLTFQGVRAMENATGQWTTPDAYAGDVHDPMSQKAFMWDRSNPYEYGDPSGYAPQQLLDIGTYGRGFYSIEEAKEVAYASKRHHRDDDPKGPRKKKGMQDEGDHPVRGEPGYMENSEAGKILDWGSGQTDQDIHALNVKLNALDRAQILKMTSQGLPQWKVKELYNQLARAYNRGNEHDNKTLVPRLEYLQRVLELWPGRPI